MRLSKNFFVISFVFFQFFALQNASALEWHSVVSCNDGMVVDKATWVHRGENATAFQVVLRNQDAINYFLSTTAIDESMLNSNGEYINNVSQRGYNGFNYESMCNPDNNICYVVRQLDSSSFRIEAWRTAYSKFGPQGLVANWIFRDCYTNNN
ncbi:MAG: hypothetical protein ACXVCP_09700 [Bdellovibrio sp.]